MNKVVKSGLKIDLHIHSMYSSGKDGDKVQNNSIDNLNILISKLNEYNVEMCAITDHDNFNYEIYSKLKEEEQNKGSIKKVLPGIEFSVNYKNNIVIHIVTIFNDLDDDKIRCIQNIFDSGIGKTLYKNGAYSLDDYYKVLKEINVDFIMIGHQKKSPTSQQKAKKADVMRLGKETFDELLFLEYFDAYEFHDKANEVHNKRYAIEKNALDKLRFITGSDCHEWCSYPNYDHNTIGEGNFTYIKALPTFKGLAMAITDYHRINYTNSFFGQGKSVDKVLLSIGEEEVEIPFSKGINVIIGDNSIGKSMFLNAITENRAIEEKRNLKKGYERYLRKNNIEILTHIKESDIFKYNYQGEIREIFEDPNMKADKYLSKYFPDSIDAARYRNIVEKELNRYYESIEHKFKYDERIHNLQPFTILLDEPIDKELVLGGAVKTVQTSKLQDLINAFDEIIRKLKEDILTNVELRDSDKEHIQTEIEFFTTLKLVYIAKKKERQFKKNKINIFNTTLRKYKVEYSTRQTDENNQYRNFIETKTQVINDIVSLVKEKQSISTFEFNIDATDIIPEQNPVDKYVFVSKIGIEKIDNQYMNKLIQGVLKKGNTIDIPTINRQSLRNMILRYPAEIDDSLQGLKIKLSKQLDEDFEIKQAITEDSKDVFNQLSEGFNSRIYFRLLTGEERNNGIYMIDQPEDHISQKAIKEDVLDEFRTMSKKRQVIMVTHNPQFIVNLDVDNVIFLSKPNGKFTIQSGALEYEDSNYNILKIVADNIDGGLPTIKERMKRYDKDILI